MERETMAGHKRKQSNYYSDDKNKNVTDQPKFTSKPNSQKGHQTSVPPIKSVGVPEPEHQVNI